VEEAGEAGSGASTPIASEGRSKPSKAFDKSTKAVVQKIPLLETHASPRDRDQWPKRLAEELKALIAFVQINKDQDSDWFHIECNQTGTHWFGRCWAYHEGLRYEFDMNFDLPVTYPAAFPEVCIPELEGKTVKMYRGGKICLTEHFQPLWKRNAPRFGIAHALALGLGPWLAAEVPSLVRGGYLAEKQ